MKKFTSMLAAALLVFSVAGTNLADAAEPNTIAVGGMAEQEVAPDMAYVDLGITVRANDAETARTEEAKIAQQIRRSLLGLAITDNDLQNTGYYMYQEYKVDRDGKRTAGQYVLNSSVKVTVRDLDKLSQVIDNTVKAGVTNIDSEERTFTAENFRLCNGTRKYEVSDAGLYVDDGFWLLVKLGSGFEEKVVFVFEIPSSYINGDYYFEFGDSEQGAVAKIYLTEK